MKPNGKTKRNHRENLEKPIEKLTQYIEIATRNHYRFADNIELEKYLHRDHRYSHAIVNLTFDDTGEVIPITVKIITHDEDHLEIKFKDIKTRIPYDFYWSMLEVNRK